LVTEKFVSKGLEKLDQKKFREVVSFPGYFSGGENRQNRVREQVNSGIFSFECILFESTFFFGLLLAFF
jgi:hypothetical protein